MLLWTLTVLGRGGDVVGEGALDGDVVWGALEEARPKLLLSIVPRGRGSRNELGHRLSLWESRRIDDLRRHRRQVWV